jgi:hypothetical protein
MCSSLFASAARDVGACGNAVLQATDKNVAATKAAERALDDGDPQGAFDAIASRITNLEYAYPRKSPGQNDQLLNRGLRVVALAAVRLGGAVTVDVKPTDDNAKLRNVQWAVKNLKEILDLDKDSAAKKSDYGEALAKTNATEAKKILEELAKKDVVSTAYAYAALATLRANDGEDKGRDEALAKCKAMIKKESVCRVDPTNAKKNGKSAAKT